MTDTHAHLADGIYGGGEDAIKQAFDSGVNRIILIGYNISSSLAECALAQKYDNLYFAAGIHPSDCEYADNRAIDQLIELSKNKKCVALGEIGLDYHYGKDNKETQKQAFIRQVELAKEVDLPFIVHTREATKDTIDILTSHKDCLARGFLMHCYSDSMESVKIYSDLGAYFAFGGAITFKNAKKDDTVRAVPADRIMFETDCPYMTPVPHRGEVNQPAYVSLVYQKAASILGEDVESLEQKVEQNIKKLFYKIG